MTVEELLQRMTVPELAEWMALRGVEPWGPYRDDFLATTGWGYSVLGPNLKDPGKVASDIRLPWWKDKRPEERASRLNGASFRNYLLAIGGKLEPREKPNGN